MSRLIWGAIGERLYEIGVDRGVLYIDNEPGVAWNGLVSVSEDIDGGEAKPYYIDGVKYLNRSAPEEFQATIEAYTYPEEFSRCDGTAALSTNGLFATQQARKSFGFAYRSLVGNDVHGTDFGYKIHLVYGALATPSSQEHMTMNDSMDPFNFSWTITTKAPRLGGHKPTAHFVIESRKTPAPLLAQIEDVLYGTDVDAPRLPPLVELIYLFESYDTTMFDAGIVGSPQFRTFDSGIVPIAQTSTIEGGVP